MANQIADVVASQLRYRACCALGYLACCSRDCDYGASGCHHTAFECGSVCCSSRTGACAVEAKHANSPVPSAPSAAPAAPAAAPAAAVSAKLETLKHVDWNALKPVQGAVFSGYSAPPKDGSRILVTIKHIAKLGDEHSFTPDGRDVRREFMEFSLNEWDDTALEAALQCIEKAGKGEVVAVCVGDSDADASLLKALAKGAHRAVRIWDPSLSNTDPHDRSCRRRRCKS